MTLAEFGVFPISGSERRLARAREAKARRGYPRSRPVLYRAIESGTPAPCAQPFGVRWGGSIVCRGVQALTRKSDALERSPSISRDRCTRSTARTTVCAPGHGLSPGRSLVVRLSLSLAHPVPGLGQRRVRFGRRAPQVETDGVTFLQPPAHLLANSRATRWPEFVSNMNALSAYNHTRRLNFF